MIATEMFSCAPGYPFSKRAQRKAARLPTGFGLEHADGPLVVANPFYIAYIGLVRVEFILDRERLMKKISYVAVPRLCLRQLKLEGSLLFFILAVLPLLLLACAHGGQPTQKDRPEALTLKTAWPHENSDLQVDPDFTFGRLENGVRYILRENKTPKDRVSMHLLVQAGSMAEQDNEQGIAHFLEHMLFDGSTDFAPGEMVKFFQRSGMQFGPDVNAHTGFTQTVFDVNLPDGSPENLSDGLMVLRNYATEALLLPKEVEKERKVILAEKRSRDSEAYRTARAQFKFEMPGSLVADRFPIGKDETIKAVTAPMLHSFYNAWYRPERMILVIVGDFNTAKVKELIVEEFGALQARTEQQPLPDFGTFSHRGLKTFYHYEKQAGAATIGLETVEHRTQPADSVQYQKLNMLGELAFQILQRRLDSLVQKPGSPITDTRAGFGYYLQQIKFTHLSATSKPENWKEALSALEQTLRQALDYGFTESEFERVKREYLAQLERDVQECLTQETQSIVRGIIRNQAEWRVLQSANQRMEILKPMLENITVQQVEQAFKDQWSAPHRLVLLTGNADLETGAATAEEQIAAAYRQASNLAVAPPEEKDMARFPYLPEPQNTGKLVAREHIDDLGVERVGFSNGFLMHLKKTGFRENQVMVALAFGGGKASEPVDMPGLADLAEGVLNESGFGLIDRLELEDALAAYKARINLEVREDMFVVKGEGASSELTVLFQLLHTFIVDPGYRTEALERVRKRLEQSYLAYACEVEGVIDLEARRFLAGGDSRFGMPEWEQIQQRTMAQIQEWFGAQLGQAPLELAVVGDLNIDQAVELASTYFGSLPDRSAQMESPARPAPEFPQGRQLRLTADTEIAKSLVLVAFPTDDFWDIQRTRRLSVMAEVLSERLRVHIREKLGAAYAPYAYNLSYRAYPGYGLLNTFMFVEPSKTQDLAAEVLYIAEGLKEEGPGQDEFARALDPTLTRIKDLRQNNSYWLNSVLLGAGRYPQQLQWCRTFESDYRSITADEISMLAQLYLNSDRAATIIIDPKHARADSAGINP
jgi:zinc protease